MDSTLLAVGILILAPAEGDVKVLWTTKEIPVQACREEVAAQTNKYKDLYERVSGACYVLPPKPTAAPAASAPSV